MPSRLSAPSCFDQKLSPASCFPSPHHYLNCSHQRSHDQDDHHTSATDRKIEDNEIIDDLDTRTQVMKIVEREPKKPQQQNHHLQHRLHHVIRDDGRQSENVKKWVRTVRTKLIVFQRGLHRSQKPAVMCRPVVVYNVEAEKELTQSLTAELVIDEPTLAPLITTVDRQQDHLLQYEVQQAAKVSTSSATYREAPVVVVPPPPPPVVVPAPPAPPPPPPSPPPMPAISKEEVAALKIQSAFRGHLARRAFRALRGLVRLQAVVRGYSVRKQTCYALNCMHSMVRLQVRVRGRQLLMSSATTPTASPHVPAPHRK